MRQKANVVLVIAEASNTITIALLFKTSKRKQ